MEKGGLARSVRQLRLWLMIVGAIAVLALMNASHEGIHLKYVLDQYKYKTDDRIESFKKEIIASQKPVNIYEYRAEIEDIISLKVMPSTLRGRK